MSKRNTIEADSGNICAELERLGCVYDWQMDNRGSNNSRYIFVRKPFAIKIRVSDHRGKRAERDKEISKTLFFDVGPHGARWEEAISSIEQRIRESA